jgi:hypothetical protein
MSDTSTAIAAAQIVAALQPYMIAAATTIIGGAIAVGVALLRKFTGIVLQQAFTDRLERAAATEAGKVVAAAADNLAKVQINVGSKVVADAANNILSSKTFERAIEATGMTPTRMAAMIAGEIGKLQANMTSVPATPARAKAV